jgi:hypothetical protein
MVRQNVFVFATVGGLVQGGGVWLIGGCLQMLAAVFGVRMRACGGGGVGW